MSRWTLWPRAVKKLAADLSALIWNLVDVNWENADDNWE